MDQPTANLRELERLLKHSRDAAEVGAYRISALQALLLDDDELLENLSVAIEMWIEVHGSI